MASLHCHLLVFLVVSSLWFSALGSLDFLLKLYGLPRGLFPENVKSYNLDQNMVLEVELETPCLAKFQTFVFYEKVVRANLTVGKLLGIQGLSNKELFLWLPVKAIMVNYPDTGLVVFDITMANKTLSMAFFDQPPSCRSEDQMSLEPRKGGSKQELGFGFDRIKRVVSSILYNYF